MPAVVVLSIVAGIIIIYNLLFFIIMPAVVVLSIVAGIIIIIIYNCIVLYNYACSSCVVYRCRHNYKWNPMGLTNTLYTQTFNFL
jgi:hypothetical protein